MKTIITVKACILHYNHTLPSEIKPRRRNAIKWIANFIAPALQLSNYTQQLYEQFGQLKRKRVWNLSIFGKKACNWKVESLWAFRKPDFPPVNSNNC